MGVSISQEGRARKGVSGWGVGRVGRWLGGWVVGEGFLLLNYKSQKCSNPALVKNLTFPAEVDQSSQITFWRY